MAVVDSTKPPKKFKLVAILVDGAVSQPPTIIQATKPRTKRQQRRS